MVDEKKQDWAPEPLEYIDCELYHGICDANGKSIIPLTDASDPETFKRIVAAFNVCQGIPTSILTGMSKPEYISCYDCGTEGYYIKVHGVVTATAEEKIEPGQILEKGEAEGSVRPITAITPGGDGEPLKHPPEVVDFLDELRKRCPVCDPLKILDTGLINFLIAINEQVSIIEAGGFKCERIMVSEELFDRIESNLKHLPYGDKDDAGNAIKIMGIPLEIDEALTEIAWRIEKIEKQEASK